MCATRLLALRSPAGFSSVSLCQWLTRSTGFEVLAFCKKQGLGARPLRSTSSGAPKPAALQ